MAAHDDVLVPCSQSEGLVKRIKGAALHMSEWGGHGVNVTDPEGFNQALLRFLDGC
jgi:aminoacrylate hydrolase